jgi:hypothetical protein
MECLGVGPLTSKLCVAGPFTSMLCVARDVIIATKILADKASLRS